MLIMEKHKQNSGQGIAENILNEGSKINCDETSEVFKNTDNLPPFYNEKLYRKGQEFFYKHNFSIFFSAMLGLISVLSVPSILKILMYTNKSGNKLTAYRRYMATVFHMMLWYESDFKPGSRLWKSIAQVKRLHNSTSKRSCSAGLHRISQKDMALTQFGFIGYALVRSKQVGIHDATDDELEAFVHVWRVVGYLMGMEDRFNICTGGIQEAKDICNHFIDKVFQPHIEEKNTDFLTMTKYMVEGLWSMHPILNFKILMCQLNIMVQHKQNNNVTVIPRYFELNFLEELQYNIIIRALNLQKYNWFRLYQNFLNILSLWLMKVCPFLAYYQFGVANSHVHILENIDENT